MWVKDKRVFCPLFFFFFFLFFFFIKAYSVMKPFQCYQIKLFNLLAYKAHKKGNKKTLWLCNPKGFLSGRCECGLLFNNSCNRPFAPFKDCVYRFFSVAAFQMVKN